MLDCGGLFHSLKNYSLADFSACFAEVGENPRGLIQLRSWFLGIGE
jgi:hypothetical protein